MLFLIEQIHSLTICQDLPVLPLVSLKNLLEETSSQTEQGAELRRLAFQQNVISFVLNNLKQLSHYKGKEEKKVGKRWEFQFSLVSNNVKIVQHLLYAIFRNRELNWEFTQ